MPSASHAHDMVANRGPRWAVFACIRQGEATAEYADTADAAERLRERFQDARYYQVSVYPPQGGVDLAALGRDRAAAERNLRDKTAVLRAGVLRALEDGRAEAEVARTADVDRMTVRKWAGK